MKILRKDLKHGLVKVKPESFDDLWYLSQVINAGDRVSSVTSRRIKDKDDSLRKSGGERKTINVGLNVEKTEFSSSEKTLRVSGTVSDGPADVVTLGAHHTLNIEPGVISSITKERWLSAELGRLNDAVESSVRPKFIVAVVEEGEATVAVVRESGIEFVDLSHTVGGKYDLKGREQRVIQFHVNLAKAVENIDSIEAASKVIVCGPGFFKNGFLDHVNSKNPPFAGKIIVENTGAGGRNAVKEVLNRPVVQKMIQDASVGRDIHLMERLLSEMGKDTGLSVYALPDVKPAASAGAVETLLASTDFFIRNRTQVDSLLKDVKNSAGAFHIVNSEEEAGKELDSLGGVAAILRYKIQ